MNGTKKTLGIFAALALIPAALSPITGALSIRVQQWVAYIGQDALSTFGIIRSLFGEFFGVFPYLGVLAFAIGAVLLSGKHKKGGTVFYSICYILLALAAVGLAAFISAFPERAAAVFSGAEIGAKELSCASAAFLVCVIGGILIGLITRKFNPAIVIIATAAISILAGCTEYLAASRCSLTVTAAAFGTLSGCSVLPFFLLSPAALRRKYEDDTSVSETAECVRWLLPVFLAAPLCGRIGNLAFTYVCGDLVGILGTVTLSVLNSLLSIPIGSALFFALVTAALGLLFLRTENPNAVRNACLCRRLAYIGFCLGAILLFAAAAFLPEMILSRYNLPTEYASLVKNAGKAFGFTALILSVPLFIIGRIVRGYSMIVTFAVSELIALCGILLVAFTYNGAAGIGAALAIRTVGMYIVPFSLLPKRIKA